MRKIGIVALWCLLCWGIGEAQAARYQVIDLGTLGERSWAKAINHKGRVMGVWAPTVGSAWRLFQWENGVMQNLEVFALNPGGLNNLGQIVFQDTDPNKHAILWDQGDLTDLGTLSGMNASFASGINDARQVAGHAYNDKTWVYRAFLWENGTIKDLGTLPDDDESHAYAINQGGQIVGSSSPKTGNSRAVLWRGGTPQDIGGLPGWNSHGAVDINDHDQVVGWSSSTPYESRGFLWHEGSIQDLGLLPGKSFTTPKAINNQGQVVGTCGTSPAWIWESGVLTNLNNLIPKDSGWILQVAYDINDAGQIVGTGTFQGKENRAFLLTPVPVGGSGIPTLGLLLLSD